MPITKEQISWTRITPASDPKHGSPLARSSHGVSMVQNGTRLIVIGGEHIARTPIEASNSCWAADFDPAENAWTWRLIDAKSCPEDRIAHAQATVDDKYVYIFGGRAGIKMDEKAMNDLWRLDCSGAPGTETWSQVTAAGGNPPEARSFHKMISIGKSLYIFGGCTAAGRAADLHKFDLETNSWHDLGKSLLRGRGGPNLMSFSSGKKLGVIAGFAGEETADGHVFDIDKSKWEDKLLEKELEGMRPRSVCVSGSFPSLGYSVIFGGEVDPSDRGHEGAGAFENDVLIIDEKSCSYVTSVKPNSPEWPQTRGWSDAAALEADGTGKLFLFGGLSGDDKHPERLQDFWMLEVRKD